jgi:hypothetical protein
MLNNNESQNKDLNKNPNKDLNKNPNKDQNKESKEAVQKAQQETKARLIKEFMLEALKPNSNAGTVYEAFCNKNENIERESDAAKALEKVLRDAFSDVKFIETRNICIGLLKGSKKDNEIKDEDKIEAMKVRWSDTFKAFAFYVFKLIVSPITGLIDAAVGANYAAAQSTREAKNNFTSHAEIVAERAVKAIQKQEGVGHQ